MSASSGAAPAARNLAHAPAGRLGDAQPRGEEPVDLRLLPPAGAAWAGAALGLAAPGRLAALGAGCCCAAAVALLPLACRRRIPVLVAVAVALLAAGAGTAVAALHGATVRGGPLPELTGRYATVDLTLDADPRLARPRAGGAPRPVVLSAEATRVAVGGGAEAVRSPVVLVVETDREAEWLELLPSTRLRVRALVREPMADRTGELTAVLHVSGAGPPEVTEGPSGVQRLAGAVRAALVEAASGLPGDARGLLPALVVGDDSGISPELREAVQATDLTHLIVVSGAHLALVLAVLIGSPGSASRAERGGLAGRLGIPLRATAVLGGGLVIAFVVLCRPEPSVLRAAVCGSIALLAIATGRRRSLLPALAAAALLLVLYDPTLAHDFGFLLSVLATGALLTLAPRWSRGLRARGVPARLAEALAAAAAAQVVCAPVVTVFAGRVSLVGVPCNLLAGLAFPAALVLGWLALVAAVPAPPLAAALAWLASWPTRWIAGVAHTGADLPGAELGWSTGWGGAALLAVATLLVLALGRWALRRAWLCVALALVLLAAVVRPAPLTQLLTGWPPPGWRLVACDVGQGDGLVVSAGGGSALVVDTGPDPAAMDRCLRELGVREIPLLILTHFHADHVAGLPGALRGRGVGAIETTSVRAPPEQAAFVEGVAAEAGVPVRPAGAGERRRLEGAGSEVSWEVLWPPPDASAAGLGANDASVTLLVRTGGLALLLPGDLEPAAQRQLLAAHPGLPEVDVLKVAHHGSGEQHEPLLERLSPTFALISCGEDNPYGHPADATVAALRRVGATVLRTDEDGALAVTATERGEPRAVAR